LLPRRPDASRGHAAACGSRRDCRAEERQSCDGEEPLGGLSVSERIEEAVPRPVPEEVLGRDAAESLQPTTKSQYGAESGPDMSIGSGLKSDGRPVPRDRGASVPGVVPEPVLARHRGGGLGGSRAKAPRVWAGARAAARRRRPAPARRPSEGVPGSLRRGHEQGGAARAPPRPVRHRVPYVAPNYGIPEPVASVARAGWAGAGGLALLSGRPAPRPPGVP